MEPPLPQLTALSCPSVILGHFIQTSRGTWAFDAHQPTDRHGGNARFDEEANMSDTPFREPPPGTERVYWRPDPDMTDEEIKAWASAFVDAVLGDVPGHEDDPR